MDEAAKQAALDALAKAVAKYRRYEKARDELHAAIVEAFRAGNRPSEIEKVSPYDRNHNARLRDAAGIPTTRPGTVVSRKAVKRTASRRRNADGSAA